MADNRYRGDRREGWQGREDSIFSDDDDRWSRGSGRWSGEPGRDRGGRGEEDRTFFERAGDEVRSWFGDEEAERRRERDARPDEGDPGRFPERGFERERGGQRSFGGGRSHWDDNYRAWRERQIQQFDREYEDYCRERQHQFEQDFDSWRGSRLTEGGTSGQFGASGSGETLEAPGGATVRGGAGSRSQGSAAGTAGALGAETAGSATAAGGTGSLESSGGSPGGARGGRARN